MTRSSQSRRSQQFDVTHARRMVTHIHGYGETWRKMDPRQRAARFKLLQEFMADKSTWIAATVAEELGRPEFEVMSQEILPVLEMLRYCRKKVPQWLRPKRLPFMMPGFLRSSHMLYRDPIGSFSVIGPANFPFSLPLMTMTYVALAGNSVFLKLSDHTPHTAQVIESLLRESSLLGSVVATISGGPEAARFLVHRDVSDKVVVFGSRGTGSAIEDRCRQQRLPFILELGGGSIALVLEDADVDKAASGIAWSAFYANARSCVRIGRVLVSTRIADRFREALQREVSTMWSENGKYAAFHPEIAKRIRTALRSGASYISRDAGAGGASRMESPGVLLDVDVEDAIFRLDIEAPLLVVGVAERPEQYLSIVHDWQQPLGVSIWTGVPAHGLALARRCGAGMIWINEASVGFPHLPWLGWRSAGTGSLFSSESLHEVTRMKHVSISRYSRRRVWWQPYSGWKKRSADIVTQIYKSL